MIDIRQMVQIAVSNTNNPIIKSAYNKYLSGDVKGLNELADNLCKEKGIDRRELEKQIKTRFNI